MLLSELARPTRHELIGRDVEVKELIYNSRKVKNGDVFCCIVGTFADGHKYAQQAVDAGAAAVLREAGKSLLPIGMVAVEGEFVRGDVIAVRDAAGSEIARGLANYASAEARLLCRKPSSEFERLLGYAADPEMVHRDNMVLTQG